MSTASPCPIFEFPSKKAITWVQTSRNVVITGISNGHVSVLLEAGVARLGSQVVLHVLCLITGSSHDPRSRSGSPGFLISENYRKLHFFRSISSAFSVWNLKVMLMIDYDNLGPTLQLIIARFLARQGSTGRLMLCSCYFLSHSFFLFNDLQDRSSANFQWW